jgi:hypothetical protein
MGQVTNAVPGMDDTTTVTVGSSVYSAPGDDYNFGFGEILADRGI